MQSRKIYRKTTKGFKKIDPGVDPGVLFMPGKISGSSGSLHVLV
jgi:hypothetical protein